MKLPAALMVALALCCSARPAFAQASAQPFLAPPTLAQKAPAYAPLPAARRMLNAQPATGGDCSPDGDIHRDGHDVNLNLVVETRPNAIYNPSTGVKDQVRLRSYGGCLSGPLIEVQPGDTLRVNLVNALTKDDPSCASGIDPGCFNTINLHVHGMHVSPAGNSDNVLLNIAPQTRFGYEINVPSDHPAGTYWYHAHRHGSTALQVASGAAGVLVVRGKRPYVGQAPGDIDTILHDAAGQALPERIFLFQQIPYACFDGKDKRPTQPYGTVIAVNGVWSCPPAMTGVVEDFTQQLGSPIVWGESGRFTSINGAVQPTLQHIAAGAIQHWRFVHAGIHDTVNLQIVPMVSTGAKARLALQGILTGTPREQAATIAEICPVLVPYSSKPVDLVPQFEIAADGLTRRAVRPIGVKQQSVSGGIGSNFLQPGYRSDVLLVFPKAGTYCMLNQAATPQERTKQAAGGQGPNQTQLLATVIVSGGKVVSGDPQAYIQNALVEANKGNKKLPVAALNGLRKGDLSPWRAMTDLSDAVVNKDQQKADFFIGDTTPGVDSTFGFYINHKAYDPGRIDFTRQVGSADDWVLSSSGEPHIFHIHVNPFQVMDVVHAPPGAPPRSIFGPNGECLVPPNSVGLQNQYCGMWHSFKDTIFVQNDYKVLVRTRYERYIGEFVIHCHILDHEDSGMMANIRIVPDASAAGGGIGMHHAGHGSVKQP